MRIIHPSVTRPDWYDRNPIVDGVQTSTVGASPHSDTLRGSYTVPGNCRFKLGSVCAHIRRASAATTVSQWGIYLVHYDGSTERIVAKLVSWNNEVNHYQNLNAAPDFVARAGDVFRVYTFDNSTGGMCEYYMTVLGTRFDL